MVFVLPCQAPSELSRRHKLCIDPGETAIRCSAGVANRIER